MTDVPFEQLQKLQQHSLSVRYPHTRKQPTCPILLLRLRPSHFHCWGVCPCLYVPLCGMADMLGCPGALAVDQEISCCIREFLPTGGERPRPRTDMMCRQTDLRLRSGVADSCRGLRRVGGVLWLRSFEGMLFTLI